MHLDVLPPTSGPGYRIWATVVRAAGKGEPGDADRLTKAIFEVALEGYDILLILKDVEQLGPDGIDALKAVGEKLRTWDSGNLQVLAPVGPILDELNASELGPPGWLYPRLVIDEMASRDSDT